MAVDVIIVELVCDEITLLLPLTLLLLILLVLAIGGERKKEMQ
jgi:hypothetical protein